MTREEAIFCERTYLGETDCDYCKYHGCYGLNCLYHEAHRMAIEALKQHFIPVSEGLPDDGVYIVYAPDYRGGSSSAKENYEGIMFSKIKNGKWSVEHGYYKRPGCVKAWMPLPRFKNENEKPM